MSPRERVRGAARLDGRGLAAAKRRFTEIFPGRLRDATYLDWERDYKVEAHDLFRELLAKKTLAGLIEERAYGEIADRALAVYTRPKLNLVALYEVMALRDALKDPAGARRFAPALWDVLYGDGAYAPRFDAFVGALDAMPQRQSRLAKWPVVTLYPFLAAPRVHLLLKPNLVKRAAAALGYDLGYQSRPNARGYQTFLAFADAVEEALASWAPRDRIDVQGFLWVVFSDEYPDT